MDGLPECPELSHRKGIRSVELAYLLLEPFLTAAKPFTLKQLAAAAGMSSPKAYFYLTSLMRIGLVRRDAQGLFALGPVALRVGLAALAQVDVLQESRAGLVALRDALQASAFASVWTEGGALIVHCLQGAHNRAWQMAMGAVLPPLTATGRVFLAFEPAPVQRRLVAAALAAADPADAWQGESMDDMLALLASIRESGISPGSGAVVPGFTSLAAPVLDREGRAAAALTVIGSTADFDASLDGPNASALRAVTARISAAIGGRPAGA